MPGSSWKQKNNLSKYHSVEAIVPILKAKKHWPKADAVKTFTRCGLTVAGVYVLEDSKTVQKLENGKVSAALTRDLRRLLEAPILVRSDVVENVEKSGLLLPRSNALKDVEAVTSFLCETAKGIAAQGISPREYCFTLHQFIAARAGAFAYAKPGVPRVHIDASWGGPDSLLFYPHDTYVVDNETLRISKKIRAKSHYLDMNEDGTWVEVSAGAPWDWKQVLSTEQVIDIGKQTRLVAEKLGKPVEVMFFVGVLDSEGREINLPWFCTDKVAALAGHATSVRYTGRRLTVTEPADLERIKHEWITGRLHKPFAMRLRPRFDMLRNEQFLIDAAEFSRDNNISIELEGSVLGHCYYVLRRKGARVDTIDAFEESSVSRRYAKLVRDNMPLRIESHGEKPRLLHVSAPQLLELLKAKAVEEALEVFWESHRDRIIEELIDLLEVVESTALLCDQSLKQLLAAAEAKREERGGFRHGTVLLETRSVPLLTQELTEQGLFSEELPKRRGRTSRKNIAGRMFAQTRRPRLAGDQVVISLVPPFSIDRRRETVISLPDGIHEAVVRYAECEVSIAIRERVRNRRDPRQLTFGFLEAGT